MYNKNQNKMTQEQLRMQMLAGVITESEYKIHLEENNNESITVTKEEFKTFLDDWDQGYGSWSDTSRRIVNFLGIDETDGL